MEQVFINVLNNAITVSALIVAIIVVRALGKNMPKWSICMLWVIVAVKLIVPIRIESVLSLVPTGEPIKAEIVMEESMQMSSGISNVVGIANPETGYSVAKSSVPAANPVKNWFHIGGIMWLIGMVAMLTYAVATYVLIRKRVSASVKVVPKVYECDDISDSFILGVISPKVYLPSRLSEKAREYILKHEFAHLSRYDHVWKPLGFAILSVYWFNPLCWVAYILLCKDIEYACDEKVTKNIEKDKKAEYCRILLENSMPKKMIAACPVAFGETDVKNRIKNVANYKRPAFWITLASIAVFVAVGACFATSRTAVTVNAEQAESKETEQGKEEQQVQTEPQEQTDRKVVESSADLAEENGKFDWAAVANDIIAYSEELTEKASKLEDAQFMYNGNVVSVMDSFEAIDTALGGYDHEPGFGEAFYEYKKDNELYSYINVAADNDTILPVDIGIMKDCIFTSRNIKVGSSRDDVIAAYGKPNVAPPKVYGADDKELTGDAYIEAMGELLIYDFGDFQICFCIKDGKVYAITYQNNINYKFMTSGGDRT